MCTRLGLKKLERCHFYILGYSDVGVNYNISLYILGYRLSDVGVNYNILGYCDGGLNILGYSD